MNRRCTSITILLPMGALLFTPDDRREANASEMKIGLVPRRLGFALGNNSSNALVYVRVVVGGGRGCVGGSHHRCYG